MKTARSLIIIILTLAANILPLKSEETPVKQWKRGTFRVNTDVSAGDLSIENTLEKSEKANLDFIVFSDQFLVYCEYGLPPFKKTFKYGKDRKSIVTYGVEAYVNRIKQARSSHPDMVIIPGADIAPFYYWTGNPLRKTLTCNQYSEQLTVFGCEDPEFYKNLPVIHNDLIDILNWRNIFRLFPLLLCLVGFGIFFRKKSSYYQDRQGNSYDKPSKLRRPLAALIFLIGILWTWDNRPFISSFGFNQYSDSESKPFQQVLDYIRENGSSETGVVWSAPEATMKMKIIGVSLLTKPYLDDIQNTTGFNGLAGIYADASTAHQPGKLWDKLLGDFCKGKRELKPVITGESDYHGRNPIDLIQTVIHTNEFNRSSVIKAILNGNSYAVSKKHPYQLLIDKATLKSATSEASLGETLKGSSKGNLIFHLSGKVTPTPQTPFKGTIVTVLNGEKIAEEITTINQFSIKKIIKPEKIKKGLNYIRFYIRTRQSGWLLANPIFFKGN